MEINEYNLIDNVVQSSRITLKMIVLSWDKVQCAEEALVGSRSGRSLPCFPHSGRHHVRKNAYHRN